MSSEQVKVTCQSDEQTAASRSDLFVAEMGLRMGNVVGADHSVFG